MIPLMRYMPKAMTHPKMMSIGLHCRLIGRPGRVQALKRFLEHASGHDGVWFATRQEIAEHWAKTHPPVHYDRPSEMQEDAFVAAYGSIYEHSPWVAQAAYASELGQVHDTAAGLAGAMATVFRGSDHDKRLAVLTAHPDLAGKLAEAKRLTAESTTEQASAGLDALTDEERTTFQELNATYVAKHGFPFIIAVRDHTKASIMKAFHTRIDNDTAVEFDQACYQVTRIGLHRLKDLLP